MSKYLIKSGQGNNNANTELLNDMAEKGYVLISAYCKNNQDVFIFEQKTTKRSSK